MPTPSVVSASGGPGGRCMSVAKYPLASPVMDVTSGDLTLVRASHGRITRANATCSRSSSTPAAA